MEVADVMLAVVKILQWLNGTWVAETYICTGYKLSSSYLIEGSLFHVSCTMHTTGVKSCFFMSICVHIYCNWMVGRPGNEAKISVCSMHFVSLVLPLRSSNQGVGLKLNTWWQERIRTGDYSVRACNYVKIATGRNFPPVLKIVTRTAQAALMLLCVHMTRVLFLVLAALTMGFYWSYTLLL